MKNKEIKSTSLEYSILNMMSEEEDKSMCIGVVSSVLTCLINRHSPSVDAGKGVLMYIEKDIEKFFMNNDLEST